ncbi:MAG: hypothetical protein WD076_04180, partial [Parvularculaceae bacterium]
MRTAAAALLLAACSDRAPTPAFHASGFPEHISDWGVLSTHDGVLELSQDAIPFDLATPLFSDYALKLRTITLPEGTTATYSADGAFDLPVGTIISKTFYYPITAEGAVAYGEERTATDGVMALGGIRLIETRILARRAEAWIALPYVWNAEQTEATLKRAGAIVPLTLHRPDGREEAFNYLVPNTNECAGCHATNATTRAILPIGLKARHLNKPSTFAPGFNQLDWWIAAGLLDAATIPPSPAGGRGAGGEGRSSEQYSPHRESADAYSTLSRVRVWVTAAFPRNAVWGDESFSIEARARAYLDANCSHCHSDVGPADTSGLDLRPSAPLGPKFGLCKTPI